LGCSLVNISEESVSPVEDHYQSSDNQWDRKNKVKFTNRSSIAVRKLKESFTGTYDFFQHSDPTSFKKVTLYATLMKSDFFKTGNDPELKRKEDVWKKKITTENVARFH
jgi:hypothetical protein